MQFLRYGSELEEEEMSAILQDVPEVHAAYTEYKRFTADPVMREKIKARERYWTDWHLDRNEAREEGREEGREEERLMLARNLKREGLDSAFIAKMTGLSLSDIEQLN
jgi:predicted transposase/invertase (TIGR01784 family)